MLGVAEFVFNWAYIVDCLCQKCALVFNEVD